MAKCQYTGMCKLLTCGIILILSCFLQSPYSSFEVHIMRFNKHHFKCHSRVTVCKESTTGYLRTPYLQHAIFNISR